MCLNLSFYGEVGAFQVATLIPPTHQIHQDCADYVSLRESLRHIQTIYKRRYDYGTYNSDSPLPVAYHGDKERKIRESDSAVRWTRTSR